MDAENLDLFITQDTFIPDETADIEESAIGFCKLLDADLTQLFNEETRERASTRIHRRRLNVRARLPWWETVPAQFMRTYGQC